MRHTDSLLSPARALHRALLIEFASTSNGLPPTPLSLSSYASTSRNSPRTWLPSLTYARPRPRAPGTPHCPRGIHAFSRMFSDGVVETKRKQMLRDYEIPYRWVQIVDGSGGPLSEPRQTATVLAELERGYSLVMVAPPAPAPPPAPGVPMIIKPPAAICRIVDTVAEAKAAKAAAAEAKEMAKEAKKLERQMKRLELNYAIAPHDLRHKVKRLHEFLGKGLRVEVLLARKRGSRKTTRPEEEQLVNSVREAALAVSGATEYKKMDGTVGAVVTMYFEGPPQKKKKRKRDNDDDVDDEGAVSDREASTI